MNSLLSDLQADYHNELLEKGNLKKRRVVHAPFASQPWVSEGYLARVLRSTCGNCGAQTDSLMGLFHSERRGSDRREQIMSPKGFQLPPNARAWREILPITVQTCLDCLPENFK